MEQNIVVVMLDEEIDRLEQVRGILQSLIDTGYTSESLLAVAQETTHEPEVEGELDGSSDDASASHAVPVRRMASRRGIRTGPRARKQPVAAPRALDSAVPSAPVVVSPAERSTHKAVVVAPPRPQHKAGHTDKLDALLAAAFANAQSASA